MTQKVQTIKEIQHNLSHMFESLYPSHEASSIASLIIEEFTGLGRVRQLTSGDAIISEEAEKKISVAAQRIKAGEPLQYVLGYTIFCGHRIEVSPAVLIPRPETEEMTSMIIAENKGFKGIAIDYCTGSGCIAVAVALAFPEAVVFATDISADAINIASRNASVNNAEIRFQISDLLGPMQAYPSEVDIIISNPPYVRECEKKFMRSNVVDHEPQAALFVTDEDPLRYYSRLAEIAARQLSHSGKIYLEINEAFGAETAKLFTSLGFKDVSIIKDFYGKERMLKAERNDRA